MTRTLRVGVVLPLANEADTIDELLADLLRWLSLDDAVFCVVDKASRDATWDKVTTWGFRESRVRPVWSPQNKCVVDAYFAGYRRAYDEGARWILEMDGGFSHSPLEIPRFLSQIDKGYDFVAGCRFMAGGSHTGSFRRRLVSVGGTILANRLLGTRMRDMTSGFEMFSRKAMAHILFCGVRSRGTFFQTEIKYLLRYWFWVEVPISYRATKSTLRAGSIAESLRILWDIRRAANR